MTLLLSILVTHVLVILQAKFTREGNASWIPIFVLTLVFTLCFMLLMFRMQPPDTGV